MKIKEWIVWVVYVVRQCSPTFLWQRGKNVSSVPSPFALQFATTEEEERRRGDEDTQV